MGNDVVEVVISADGSWKAVFRDDDHVDKVQNDAHISGMEPAEPKESTCSHGVLSNVLDLTNDDDIELLDACETTDRKPQLEDLQSQILSSLSMNPAGVNQEAAAPMEEDFWSGVDLLPDIQTVVSNRVLPVMTDAISQATNQEAAGNCITLSSDSTVQNQFSAPNNFQMQQLNHLNSAVNEHGRLQHIPRHVTRNPVAVQALPAQPQALASQQRSRTTLGPGSSTVAPRVSVSGSANCFSPVLSDTERQQHFSRPIMNRPQIAGLPVTGPQHHSATQVEFMLHIRHLFFYKMSIIYIYINKAFFSPTPLLLTRNNVQITCFTLSCCSLPLFLG